MVAWYEFDIIFIHVSISCQISEKFESFPKCTYIIHFFFLIGCTGFVAVLRLSLVVASRGYCLLPCSGFSLQWLLLLWSTGFRHMSFNSCSMWAQSLWCMGLVASRHVGSPRTGIEPISPALAEADSYPLHH